MGMTNDLTAEALALVILERGRQNKKWGVQRHPMGDWMMILQEELGEFAEACQKGSVQSKETDSADKKMELVQVVAVALAMLEQVIEEEKLLNIKTTLICINCGCSVYVLDGECLLCKANKNV